MYEVGTVLANILSCVLFLVCDSFVKFKGFICIIKKKDPATDFLHYCQEEITALMTVFSCFIGSCVTIYLINNYSEHFDISRGKAVVEEA